MTPLMVATQAALPLGLRLEQDPRVERLTLASRLSEMSRFEIWLNTLSDELALSARTTFALDLVLNEALANVITHGFAGREDGRIDVQLEIYSQALIAWVIDDARPFNPLQAPPMRRDLDLQTATIGGRGIHLIKSYADELGYRHQDGRNHLRMLIQRRA